MPTTTNIGFVAETFVGISSTVRNATVVGVTIVSESVEVDDLVVVATLCNN